MRKVLTENQLRRLVRILIEMNAGDTISRENLLSANQIKELIQKLKNAPEELQSFTVEELFKLSDQEIAALSKSSQVPSTGRPDRVEDTIGRV